MAVIASMIDVNSFPSVGSIIGSTMSNDALRGFNSKYGGGTMFGNVGDPEAQRYQAFINLVVTPSIYTTNQIMLNGLQLSEDNNIIPIINTEALMHIPACMHIPILTYEPIRKKLEDGVIYGFGYEPDQLPEEDIVGRLINNGRVIFNDNTKVWKDPTEFVWEFKDTDPIYSEDELDILETSREFIAEMLRNEIAPGGSRRDPTDWASGGYIGKIK